VVCGNLSKVGNPGECNEHLKYKNSEQRGQHFDFRELFIVCGDHEHQLGSYDTDDELDGRKN